MKRVLLVLPFILLIVVSGGIALSADVQATGDGDTWLDLMPGPDLRGWKRVPIAPDTKLNAKNAWKLDRSGKLLVCDGVGVKEMLLYNKEFADGTFHVEWRFRKVTDKTDYNSGVYVRTSADGKIWHQAQVAHVDKAPHLGDLFGETLVNGKPQRFVVEGRGLGLAHPPGGWNTYDVTCQGPLLTVSVNGKPATRWDGCKVSRGHVGLQAEYFFIEFKNLKFKSS
jgi:hypothetical protein